MANLLKSEHTIKRLIEIVLRILVHSFPRLGSQGYETVSASPLVGSPSLQALGFRLGSPGYMMVSDVGLTAMGCSSSDCPDFVTQATSGENPSM